MQESLSMPKKKCCSVFFKGHQLTGEGPAVEHGIQHDDCIDVYDSQPCRYRGAKQRIAGAGTATATEATPEHKQSANKVCIRQAEVGGQRDRVKVSPA